MDRLRNSQDMSTSTYCRTCLETLNDIHHDIFTSPDLLKKFSLCTSLLVEPGDEFPTSLCELCYTKINDFYEFKQMCLAAAERFQEYLNSEKKPCVLKLDIDSNSQKMFIVLNKYEEPDYDQHSQDSEHEPPSNKEEQDESEDNQAILKSSLECDNSINETSKFKENEKHSCELKTVKSKNTIMCKICNKFFRKPITLERHMLIHKGLKPFCCSYCEKTFRYSHQVKYHEMIHTGETPYKCNICQTDFRHRSSLIRHKNVHLGELKRHKAVDRQNKSSSKPDKLDPKSQMLNELEEQNQEIIDTVDRSFKCKICHQKFRHYSSLIRHKKIHLGELKTNEGVDSQHESSSKAGKLDPKSQMLNEEEKYQKIMNTVERSFKCNICHKNFRHDSSLIRHKKLHLRPLKKRKAVGRKYKSSSKADKQDPKRQKLEEKDHRHAESLQDTEHEPSLKEDEQDRLNNHQAILKYEVEYHNSDKEPCALESDPISQKRFEVLNEYEEKDHGQCSEFVEYELSIVKSEHVPPSETKEPEEKNNNQTILKNDDDCQNSNSTSTHTTSELNENEDTTAVNKTNLMCEICNKISQTVDALEKHMRIHNGLKPYPCSYCKKSFNRVDNRRFHERNHSKQCDLCHKKFTNLSSLKNHRKVHLEDLDEHKGFTKVTCQLCYESFIKPNQLKNHIDEHDHSLLTTGSFQYSGIISDKLSNITIEDYSTSKKDELDKNDKECDNSSNNTSKYNENEHSTKEIKIVTYRKTNLLCEICKKLFNKAANLEIHMRIHNGLKPYLCSHCGYSFNRVYHRDVHEMTHTKHRPYECKLCYRKFTTKSNLNRHKIFHQNLDLKRNSNLNEKTKRRQKPYQCNVCKRKFIFSIHFERHKMRATCQEKPKETKFMCEICKKCFKKAETLERHIPVHNGLKKFSCSYCGASFGRACNRMYHERTHTGEKPHECDECHRKFLAPNALRRHLKIHLKL